MVPFPTPFQRGLCCLYSQCRCPPLPLVNSPSKTQTLLASSHQPLPGRESPPCLAAPERPHFRRTASFHWSHFSGVCPSVTMVTLAFIPSPQTSTGGSESSTESSDSVFIPSCSLELAISQILLASGPLCVSRGPQQCAVPHLASVSVGGMCVGKCHLLPGVDVNAGSPGCDPGMASETRPTDMTLKQLSCPGDGLHLFTQILL